MGDTDSSQASAASTPLSIMSIPDWGKALGADWMPPRMTKFPGIPGFDMIPGLTQLAGGEGLAEGISASGAADADDGLAHGRAEQTETAGRKPDEEPVQSVTGLRTPKQKAQTALPGVSLKRATPEKMSVDASALCLGLGPLKRPEVRPEDSIVWLSGGTRWAKNSRMHGQVKSEDEPTPLGAADKNLLHRSLSKCSSSTLASSASTNKSLEGLPSTDGSCASDTKPKPTRSSMFSKLKSSFSKRGSEVIEQTYTAGS